MLCLDGLSPSDDLQSSNLAVCLLRTGTYLVCTHFPLLVTSILFVNLLHFPYSAAEVGLNGRKGICELGVACEQVLRKLALTLTN